MSEFQRAALLAALEALQQVNSDDDRQNSFWGVFGAEIKNLRTAMAEDGDE